MYGLLAISASHSAILSAENSTKEAHRKRYVQFLAEFCSGLENMTTILEVNVQNETVEMCMKIGLILHCVQSNFAQSPPSDESLLKSGATFDLGYFMQTVPNFLVSHPGVHPGEERNESKATQDDSFARATRIFKTVKSGNPGNIGILPICDDQPSAMLDHLRSLPSRMAEVFGKPERVQDVLAAISAIAVLAECFEASFASDTVETAWRCMARWSVRVPDHFYYMVSQNSPLSLVVIAYWSAYLVKRVEDSGCWFLMGLSKPILLQVAEQLSTHGRAAQSLVENLL
jgi:hypothetical protein